MGADLSQPEAIQLELLLRFEDETVSGLLVGADRGTTEFVGWLGLLSALERLKAGDRSP